MHLLPLQQTALSLLQHHPAPQPHFDGMRAQAPRPGAGLRPCRQQGRRHHGQAGGTAPDHTARTPHAQGHGKHVRACCSRTTAAASFPAIAVLPRPEQLRDATGQAGQQATRTGLRHVCFMGDSCLFPPGCASGTRAACSTAIFEAQPTRTRRLPCRRTDPVNLWRNNGELFRERARLHR